MFPRKHAKTTTLIAFSLEWSGRSALNFWFWSLQHRPLFGGKSGGGWRAEQQTDDSVECELEDFRLINERKGKGRKGQVEIESERANLGSWKGNHSLVRICASVCWCVCVSMR